MWTAFGIMIGNVMDLAFYHVQDTPNIKGLNWRLMLGSVSVIYPQPLSHRLTTVRRPVFPLSSS